MSDQYIKDFINAAVNKKPVDALDAFSKAMDERLAVALPEKRLEVINRLFNTEEVEDLDDEDLELTDEEIDEIDIDDLDEEFVTFLEGIENLEEMDQAELDKMVADYKAKGGKVTKVDAKRAYKLDNRKGRKHARAKIGKWSGDKRV